MMFPREELMHGYRCKLCGEWSKSHADDCVLKDEDVTHVRLTAMSQVRPEICLPCRIDAHKCPAPGGWGNDTHRRLLRVCDRYKKENAK